MQSQQQNTPALPTLTLWLLLAFLLVAVVLILKKKLAAPVSRPRTRKTVQLIEKQQITHDTIVLKFKGDAQLTVGKHISIEAEIKGQLEARKYTPISRVNETSFFDLLIKVYKPLPPRWPEGGKMSQYLDSLKLGDRIQIQTPFGNFGYPQPGQITIGGVSPRTATTKSFLMIAGGSGITPVYQVTKQILENKADKTQICIIFANKTEQDILMRKELDGLAANSRVKVIYTVDIKPEDPEWQHFIGFLNSDMIRKGLQLLGDRNPFCLMCGPKPMMGLAQGLLRKENIPDERQFQF